MSLTKTLRDALRSNDPSVHRIGLATCLAGPICVYFWRSPLVRSNTSASKLCLTKFALAAAKVPFTFLPRPYSHRHRAWTHFTTRCTLAPHPRHPPAAPTMTDNPQTFIRRACCRHYRCTDKRSTCDWMTQHIHRNSSNKQFSAHNTKYTQKIGVKCISGP